MALSDGATALHSSADGCQFGTPERDVDVHLDVAVGDAQAVAVVDGHDHLLEDAAGLLLWHARAL